MSDRRNDHSGRRGKVHPKENDRFGRPVRGQQSDISFDDLSFEELGDSPIDLGDQAAVVGASYMIFSVGAELPGYASANPQHPGYGRTFLPY